MPRRGTEPGTEFTKDFKVKMYPKYCFSTIVSLTIDSG